MKRRRLPFVVVIAAGTSLGAGCHESAPPVSSNPPCIDDCADSNVEMGNIDVRERDAAEQSSIDEVEDAEGDADEGGTGAGESDSDGMNA